MKKKRYYLFLTLLAVLFVTSIFWVADIIKGKMPYADKTTRAFVDNVDHPTLYFISRWVTELGSKSFVVPFAVVMAIVLWIIFREFLPSLMFLGGTLGSHLLNKLIKAIVERDRPHISALLDAEGYSFPSGHAMVSIVCYGLLAYFLTRKIKSIKGAITVQVLFAVLILLIGMSRYIVRAHYLTDIVAGYTFGLIFLFCWVQLYRYIQRRRKHSFALK